MIEAEITQRDINLGAQGDCHDCPTALALRRVAPESFIHVGRFYIEVCGIEYATPPEILAFISRFDAGRECQPMRFKLMTAAEREADDSKTE